MSNIPVKVKMMKEKKPAIKCKCNKEKRKRLSQRLFEGMNKNGKVHAKEYSKRNATRK